MAQADKKKWDAKYTGREGSGQHDPWLDTIAHLLPDKGAALDVAGGAGRNALWMARRGLRVTLTDISTVGMEIALGQASREGLSLSLLAADLDSDPLSEGPWDIVMCLNFLDRRLFGDFKRLLAPGGVLVFAQPTLSNLQRHKHPSERYLLQDGELPELVQGLDIRLYEEGWADSGRYEARVVARKGED